MRQPGDDSRNLHYPLQAVACSPSCELNYRTAIALNNTGVSLLQRGSYKNALETFKDSVTLLRQAIVGNTQHDSLNDCLGRYSRLDLAAKRLATAFRPSVTSSVTNAWVVPISHDDTGFRFLSGSVEQSRGPGFVFPVWIERCTENLRFDGIADSSEGYAGREGTEFEFSLILYNFALAHLCVVHDLRTRSSTLTMDRAQQDNINEYRISLENGAMRLFRAIYGVLTEDGSDGRCTSLWMEEARLTLVCLSLTHLHAMRGLESSAGPVAEESSRLSLAIHALQRWRLAMSVLGDGTTSWGDAMAGNFPSSAALLHAPDGPKAAGAA
jgi:hypothetical protein